MLKHKVTAARQQLPSFCNLSKCDAFAKSIKFNWVYRLDMLA